MSGHIAILERLVFTKLFGDSFLFMLQSLEPRKTFPIPLGISH